MAKNQVRAGDLTGRQKAELAEKHAEEQTARAAQISMITAQQAAKSDEVLDLAPKVEQNPTHTVAVIPEEGEQTSVVEEIKPVVTPAPAPALAVQEVSVKEDLVEFRTNDTFECTIGHGNDYSFVEGQKVRAPRWIRDHLEEKGLVWH